MLELSDILSFAAVAALLVMSPGPNGVLIAKTVSLSGRGAGAANVAGFVSAFYLHGLLSIFGISILLTQSATAFFIVKLAGALYLCWLGLQVLRGGRGGGATPGPAAAGRRRRKLGGAFAEGFITNALNPKVSMFYLAAFPQFISPASGGLQALLLVVIHSAINAVWFSLMILFFGYFDRAGARVLFQRVMRGITGAALLGFGGTLAATAF
ncbi:MAG: LysE family translocator [Gammaproteobacteria bacterium]|nr:LysE family translocator [Gammaproteobacteria bacterium]